MSLGARQCALAVSVTASVATARRRVLEREKVRGCPSLCDGSTPRVLCCFYYSVDVSAIQGGPQACFPASRLFGGCDGPRFRTLLGFVIREIYGMPLTYYGTLRR